ncbi:hypothetical protein NB311A_04554 [Nitrobacter sp. Nb-311A]|nr:hypothetical protein NB311A_04554 [Nitrobacter sp. Nb-311A]
MRKLLIESLRLTGFTRRRYSEDAPYPLLIEPEARLHDFDLTILI